jgi:hypothetical protein
MKNDVKYDQYEDKDVHTKEYNHYLDEYLQGAEGMERFAQMVQLG